MTDTAAQIARQTMNLRLLAGHERFGVLQQAWMNSDGSITWKTIPTVKEEDNG